MLLNLFPSWPWRPPKAKVTNPQGFSWGRTVSRILNPWKLPRAVERHMGKLLWGRAAVRLFLLIQKYALTLSRVQKYWCFQGLACCPNFLSSSTPTLLYYFWLLPSRALLNHKYFYISPSIRATEKVNDYEEEKTATRKGWRVGKSKSLDDSLCMFLCEWVTESAWAWLERGAEEVCKKGRQVIRHSACPPLISSSHLSLPFCTKLFSFSPSPKDQCNSSLFVEEGVKKGRGNPQISFTHWSKEVRNSLEFTP